MNRHFKQSLYGLFYLAVIVAVAYFSLGYLFLNEQCEENCEDEVLLPLSVGDEIDMFYLDSGAFAFLGEIYNPNPMNGAEFYYSLELFDEGNNLIKGLSGSGFINESSDVKFIINNTLEEKPVRAKFDIRDVVWLSELENFDFSLRMATSSFIFSEESKKGNVFGTVINESAISNFDVNLSIIFRNSESQNIFAVKSVINNILSFEERDFSLLLPISADFIEEVDLDNTQFLLHSIF